MTKVFNMWERSGELLRQGVSIDEAAEILLRESREADVDVLDDGSWWELPEELEAEEEAEYQASLKS